MSRHTFILIMIGYLAIGAVLSLLMAPAAISHAHTITEVMHAAPLRYYIAGLRSRSRFLAVPGERVAPVEGFELRRR